MKPTPKLGRMEILMYDENDKVIGMMEIAHAEGHIEIVNMQDFSINLDAFQQSIFKPPPGKVTITGNLVKYVTADDGRK